MPVCSYIIYPLPGKEEALKVKLRAIPQATLHSDDQQKLFVLLTDTDSFESEKSLQKHLETIPEIQCTTLSFVGNPHQPL